MQIFQFETHPCFSSDSSSGSPQHGGYGSRVVVSSEGGGGGGPNLEIERTLPGVILSHQKSYCQFFLDLSDLGCMLGNARLRDGARYGHSSDFFLFAFCRKIIFVPGEQIAGREDFVLLFQQLPHICLGTLKGVLSRHGFLQGSST